MNEKIKTIAEFDGWKYDSGIWIKYYPDGTKSKYMTPPYLTDLNALHRVALDVMDAITELFNTPMDGDVFIHASDLEYNIKRSCYTRPINGQYTDLVDAVYEAIVYLKQHEK